MPCITRRLWPLIEFDKFRVARDIADHWPTLHFLLEAASTSSQHPFVVLPLRVQLGVVKFIWIATNLNPPEFATSVSRSSPTHMR